LGHVASTREVRNARKILIAKPERKKPLWRRNCKWEKNIKIDIKETGCADMDWIHLAKFRAQWQALANTVIKFRVP
jgi:hypothetical protein